VSKTSYGPATGRLVAVNPSRNAICEGSIDHSVRDEFSL
jgi:hypothetical protein